MRSNSYRYSRSMHDRSELDGLLRRNEKERQIGIKVKTTTSWDTLLQRKLKEVEDGGIDPTSGTERYCYRERSALSSWGSWRLLRVAACHPTWRCPFDVEETDNLAADSMPMETTVAVLTDTS